MWNRMHLHIGEIGDLNYFLPDFRPHMCASNFFAIPPDFFGHQNAICMIAVCKKEFGV